MKIQGPGSTGPPKLPGTSPVEGKAPGKDFASVLESSQAKASEKPAAASKAAQVDGVRPALDPQSVNQIAEMIRSGAVSRTEAVNLIVEKVIRAELPGGASTKVVEALRARITEMIASDPVFSQQMDQVMRHKP